MHDNDNPAAHIGKEAEPLLPGVPEHQEAEVTVRVCNRSGRPVSVMVYVEKEDFLQTDDFSEDAVEADGFLIVE